MTCGLLTPAEAGVLLGYSRRHVARLIDTGFFPNGVVVHMGAGKRRSHARLILQRLIDARLVPAKAAP